jgi:tRNA(His) 5'-end guanylyltransferase
MPVDDSSQFIKSQQATLIQKELQASIYQWFAEKSLACFGSRCVALQKSPVINDLKKWRLLNCDVS